MEKVIIGIDLGGTNLRIGGVTSENEMLAPSVISSALIAGAEQPVQALCGVIGGGCFHRRPVVSGQGQGDGHLHHQHP